MARDGKGMGGGAGAQHGAKRARDDRPNDDLKEVDLAQQKIGDDEILGNDQANVHNERHAQADAKRDPDEDVLDAFEKQDKDERASRDLGKGNRD